MGVDARNSLYKRNAALELIHAFRRAVATTPGGDGIRAATMQARERALALQGSPTDRPYLQKTISQLATTLRRAGWTAICADLLEWAIGAQLEDAFLYTELVMCHLGADDAGAAEQVLGRAEACGMVGEAIYASLVAAWGRAGRPADAQRIFDRAVRARVSGHCAYTALMDGYIRAGDLAQARAVFAQAESTGSLDPGAYAVLLRAYIKAGCAGEVARLGRQADAAGCMTDGMRTTVTQILHRAGRTRQANRFRRRARPVVSPGLQPST